MKVSIETLYSFNNFKIYEQQYSTQNIIENWQLIKESHWKRGYAKYVGISDWYKIGGQFYHNCFVIMVTNKSIN